MNRRDARTRAGGWLFLVVLVSALVLGPAGSATAHATLLGTDPAEGAVLDAAPERVTFTFDESVIGVPAGIKVFDATGAEVASSASVRGSRLFVDLDEEVADGTLVVLWRLVSEDGHPIGGSLSFAVGAPSEVVDVPAAGADADAEAPVLLGLLRGLGYAGLCVAAGTAAFVVLFLPRDRVADRSRARLRPVARVAAGVAALGWWTAVPVIALYQLGLPVPAITEGSTWSSLAPAEYVVPAAVVVGLAVATWSLPATAAPSRTRSALVLAGCAGAVTAPAFTGHTRVATPEALVVGVDVLHLAAGALWLGGLVAIAAVLGDLSRADAGAVVLGRFSAWAAGLLAVLVVAGSFLAWRIAGSWDALLDSGYGALLLVKVLTALVAVAVAGWNRFVLIPRSRATPRRKGRGFRSAPLVRTALAEAAVLVAVLAVTGFLVDRSPEGDVAVAAGESAVEGAVESVRLGDVSARITLAPPAVGPATVTIEMTDEAGEPTEGYEAPRLSLATDEVDLGTVQVSSLGPGVYAGDVVLPTTGEWDVRVSLRTTEFDNPVETVTFRVP
ncbi:copper resistance CopC/CopD family protein [Myceligenerans salitolerans]|uniref:Copper resistance protein CopC n=1 Tax=Myceligenerans salitolerans TaxID=1230528 RepID=A0ABS3I8L1_9MICO|nr:copper resistance protein CopC [Myceligenerans salitolerans]MBO0609279.1 copper resistance protein CopC [Myceligenerans salitolerans]